MNPDGQIRSVTIRLPGVLALLLAVPVLLLFDLLALATLLAGAAALVLAPWLARRQPRASDDTTITLERSAYRRADGDPPDSAPRLLVGPVSRSRERSTQD